MCRCDKTIYISGPKTEDQNDDPRMPFVYINVTDIYSRLTEKTIKTLVYIYDHLMHEFDWCLLANDDTFIIMENLRQFLANKCPSEKKVYGKILKYYRNKDIYKNGDNTRGFLQGGSGQLVSREAILLFGEAMKEDPNFCVLLMGEAEDQEMSNCFRKLNIYPGESRDELNRERFLMDPFEKFEK